MICAIDCDLRTSYCVFEDGRAGRGEDPCAALAACDHDRQAPVPTTILFEICSPVSFNRGASGHAAMTQLAKWAIWNVAQAATLWRFHDDHCIPFLVSPSNVWTRGYDLKTRHLIAKCKQPKKDLRECEAMIWFYKQEPTLWQPLPAYLSSL